MDLHWKAGAEAAPSEIRRSASPNQIGKKPKASKKEYPMHGSLRVVALAKVHITPRREFTRGASYSNAD
jgi:hypothetical protein